MREINTENDNHVFKIGIKNIGSIFIDGFELASRCSRIDGVLEGEEPKPSEIAEAMRDVSWCDTGDLSDFTDDELTAAGLKALVEINKLGNE